MSIGFRELLVVAAIVLLFVYLPHWIFGPIARKAGMSPRLGYLMGIPILSLVLIWMFAFKLVAERVELMFE